MSCHLMWREHNLNLISYPAKHVGPACGKDCGPGCHSSSAAKYKHGDFDKGTFWVCHSGHLGGWISAFLAVAPVAYPAEVCHLRAIW
jgi:hypothetical protein